MEVTMQKFGVNTVLEDGGYDKRGVDAEDLAHAWEVAHAEMTKEGKTPSTVEAACMIIPL